MSFVNAPAADPNINFTPILMMNTNHVLSEWTDEENQSSPFTTLSAHRAFITSFDAFQDARLPAGSSDIGNQANINLLTFPYGVQNQASETQNDDYYDYLPSTSGFIFPLYRISDQPDTLVVRNGVDSVNINVNGGLGYQLTSKFDLGILHHSTGLTDGTYSFKINLNLQNSANQITPYPLTLTTVNGGVAGTGTMPQPTPTSGIASQDWFKENGNNAPITQWRVMDDGNGARIQSQSPTMLMGLVETHINAASISAALGVDVSQYRLMSIDVFPLLNPLNDDTLVIYSSAVKNDGYTPDHLVSQYVSTGIQVAPNPSDILSPAVPRTSMNSAQNLYQKSSASLRINYNGLAMAVLVGMAALGQFFM